PGAAGAGPAVARDAAGPADRAGLDRPPGHVITGSNQSWQQATATRRGRHKARFDTRRRATRAVALLLAPAPFLAAWGGDDDDSAGGDEAAQQGGEVTIWIMPNGPDPVPDFEELVAPFEEDTGIDVTVEEVGWDVQFDQ